MELLKRHNDGVQVCRLLQVDVILIRAAIKGLCVEVLQARGRASGGGSRDEGFVQKIIAWKVEGPPRNVFGGKTANGGYKG